MSEPILSVAGITKNYEEFKQILPELKDITIQYDMPMGSYQLKIKQIDLHNYEITKKAFPFPEEMNLENPNKEKRITFEELLEGD